MSTWISPENIAEFGKSFFNSLNTNDGGVLTEVPENLAETESDVIFGDYGGFKIENGKLFWFNGWIGDAPGDDPMDTTYDACCEAQDIVSKLGYKIGESYTEHDYASFDISIVEE